MENPALIVRMDVTTQEMEIELLDVRLPINKAWKKLERLPRLVHIEKKRQVNAGRVGQALDTKTGGVQTVQPSEDGSKKDKPLMKFNFGKGSQKNEETPEASSEPVETVKVGPNAKIQGLAQQLQKKLAANAAA